MDINDTVLDRPTLTYTSITDQYIDWTIAFLHFFYAAVYFFKLRNIQTVNKRPYTRPIENVNNIIGK